MRELNVDQLRYSFFQSDLLKRFKIEQTKSGNHIKVQELNYENCKNIRKKIGEFYTVSCVSIMRREFFKKILNSPMPFLKRWPRGVPFDFEKLSNPIDQGTVFNYKGWSGLYAAKFILPIRKKIDSFCVDKFYPDLINKEKIFVTTEGNIHLKSDLIDKEFNKFDAVDFVSGNEKYSFISSEDTSFFMICASKSKIHKDKSFCFNCSSKSSSTTRSRLAK